MSAKNKIYLNGMGILCALGSGREEVEVNMLRGYQGGMMESSDYSQDPLVLGVVGEKLPQMPPSLSQYSCRNNQMLLHVMEQIRPALEDCLQGISPDRVGVVLGTCTGGNAEAQEFLNYYSQHQDMPSSFRPDITFMGDCADFVADYLGIQGLGFMPFILLVALVEIAVGLFLRRRARDMMRAQKTREETQ